MQFEVLKCHGSGNDFIMIDERSLNRGFAHDERRRMSIQLCDRTHGMGADGILFVLNDSSSDGRMIIYNADGSEASMCGNGLRCVVRMIAESKDLKKMRVATKGGVYHTEVVPQFFEEINGYSIKIDTVNFDANQMLNNPDTDSLFNTPVSFLPSTLNFSTVNAPNPHLIAFSEQPDTKMLVSLGESCNQKDSKFFDGVNINFFTPLKEKVIFVETYERGVGLTNACGTGMVASSVIAHRLEYIPEGEWITVVNKGGFVRTLVEKSDNNFSVYLLGNATYTFQGVVDYKFDSNTFTYQHIKDFKEEIQQYEAMVAYSNQLLIAHKTVNN
jgi:diaminopimelate epimerase